MLTLLQIICHELEVDRGLSLDEALALKARCIAELRAEGASEERLQQVLGRGQGGGEKARKRLQQVLGCGEAVGWRRVRGRSVCLRCSGVGRAAGREQGAPAESFQVWAGCEVERKSPDVKDQSMPRRSRQEVRGQRTGSTGEEEGMEEKCTHRSSREFKRGAGIRGRTKEGNIKGRGEEGDEERVKLAHSPIQSKEGSAAVGAVQDMKGGRSRKEVLVRSRVLTLVSTDVAPDALPALCISGGLLHG